MGLAFGPFCRIGGFESAYGLLDALQQRSYMSVIGNRGIAIAPQEWRVLVRDFIAIPA